MIDDGYYPGESKRFKGRYRISSTRLRGWNYAKCGWYFVTICTRGKCPWFGDIVNGRMQLSDIGEIVGGFWRGIPKRHPRVTLDTFVIMPNHVHGIVVINRTPTVETPLPPSIPNMDMQTSHEDAWGNGVSTIVVEHHRNTIHKIISRSPHHKCEWKTGCLGAIIQGFKSASTKRIRAFGHHDFYWQTRFHDHIIRSHAELIAIRYYIKNNPKKWNQDNLYF